MHTVFSSFGAREHPGSARGGFLFVPTLSTVGEVTVGSCTISFDKILIVLKSNSYVKHSCDLSLRYFPSKAIKINVFKNIMRKRNLIKRFNEIEDYDPLLSLIRLILGLLRLKIFYDGFSSGLLPRS